MATHSLIEVIHCLRSLGIDLRSAGDVLLSFSVMLIALTVVEEMLLAGVMLLIEVGVEHAALW